MRDRIKVTPEVLDKIRSQFVQAAEEVRDLHGKLGRESRRLITEGWEGRAADAFWAEWEDQVSPAIGRLAAALELAVSKVDEVGEIFADSDKSYRDQALLRRRDDLLRMRKETNATGG